jgi:hypothetical protein
MRRVVIVLSVLLALPVSGCAVLGRALTAIEVVSTVDDLAGTSRVPRDPTAVVTGTNGQGLRLNIAPGEGRITVLSDGSSVDVDCEVQGPLVTSRWRDSATWSRVRTADGLSGYLSNAYLDVDAPGEVPAC